jgi:antibiotic biosynthesis monooxygenase (ABM) superfamily enzyme
MGSAEQRPAFNQLVEFVVNPDQHTQLVAALIEQIERHTCTYPGFISASVQASDDGARVLEQILWQSRQASEQALLNAEPGQQGFMAMLLKHGVRAGTFRAFQVAGSIAPRVA